MPGFPWDRQRIGREAEERAARFLEAHGLTIILRNYRCRMGELDIVAHSGDVLAIVEVRLRSHAGFGGGAASVDFTKMRRITRTARHLLMSRPALARLRVRFDVVELGAEHAPLNWIRGAFDT